MTRIKPWQPFEVVMANHETETDTAENERSQNWKALPDGSFIWQRNRKAEARIVPSDVLDQLKRLKNLEQTLVLPLGVPVSVLSFLAYNHTVPVLWAIGAIIFYCIAGTGVYLYCQSRLERLEQLYPKSEGILQPVKIANTFLTGLPDSMLRRSLLVSAAGAIGSAIELGSRIISEEPILLGKQNQPWPALLLLLAGCIFAAYHLNRERIRRKQTRQA
ncbi:hypothetical protein [Rhizobium sp. C4]|uniref:hypothetical protein n=1 Tax=Rhizobium sp. C4 TaxID=1349800 RepID=UPI001E5AFEFA|nr:hypothetical protein [Rhizobium sp. C4]MCD2173751.1 hypothetical protein [Rhizobium sp. C4]